jgi:N-glycosylase/DNA lyase
VERGTIDCAALLGHLDLETTLESGQSYLWWRRDGHAYEGDGQGGHEGWYVTTARDEGEPIAIEARQRDGRLEWRATGDAGPILHERLGLGDDLPEIREATPADDLVDAAFDAYPGMRIVREPAVPTLVMFICSTQMRVERIFGMQQALREALGTPIAFDGRTVHAYPTADQLAASSEADLRDLGLGYRAPYVLETARKVADGEAHPAEAAGRPYEDARESLTRFVGVGEKVADCVLLFSLGYLEAVPLDTWIRKTIAEYYPDCDRGSYAETSRAIREQFGPYAGYAQTYVFHYRRSGREAGRREASD